MSELQTAEPIRGDFRWRSNLIKALIVLAAVVFWQGIIKRPTPRAFGTSLHVVDSPVPPPSGSILRVATFNINGGVSPEDDILDLSRTAKYLRGYDFVGLQEVHGAQIFDWRNQAKILGQTLHMAWLFAPSETRWWHDSFGNGVLSDLKVTSWQRLPLSTSISESNRSMLRVTADWQGHSINVLISHLDRHADHDRELGALIASFDDTPSPAILMGDLNIDADPSDTQLDTLRQEAGVVDCLRQAMGKNLPPSNDWIFCRGLKCVSAGLADDDASDHKVAWAELSEPPAQ